MNTPVARRPARGAVCLAAVLAVVLSVAGCGGGSTDTPDGVDISSGSRHLNVVAYAIAKNGFDALIPAFRETRAGSDIGFSSSFGASSDQSRKVARGLPADLVALSVEPDVTRLVSAGVVAPDWKRQAPHGSVPFGSVVVFVVRTGNPLGIRGWDDLLRPGVEVVTPNPGSSGSAKWNLLAPYAAASDGGRDPDAGLGYVRRLVRDHVRILPKSGREATSAFQQGQGDVLISYENEAKMLARKTRDAPAGDRIDYVVPETTFKIENPVAVTTVGGDPAAARDFRDFLFSARGQELWARAGFRPSDPTVAARTAGDFPGRISRLWTVADLGGWPTVDERLFGTDGAITRVYESEAGR
ncbi:sulfate ABC transporter substrate-binding protein [Gordonia shandongensis]|uniref:sulfate ABC transporter substrate-binding protein n=1 Tax=Gordonia shandongensis TaxID=376351 RepID=UPI0004203910|nr:sulfate ABC transporter substrate-binding protein [Gordonia shandongensis]